MSLDIKPTFPKIRGEQLSDVDWNDVPIIAALSGAVGYDPVIRGAKGDGNTDDWPVFQQLISEGRPIDGRGRTYRLHTNTLPANTRIRNAILRLTYGDVVNVAGDILLENVVLDYANQTATVWVDGAFTFKWVGGGIINKLDSTDFWRNNALVLRTGSKVYLKGLTIPQSILLTNVLEAIIEKCEIQTYRGNGIGYISYNISGADPTRMIWVKGNQIRAKRMGVEIWGGGGPPPKKVIVEENYIEGGDDTQAFGISVVTGESAHIRQNIVYAKRSYGIEQGIGKSIVEGNHVIALADNVIGIGIGPSEFSIVSRNVIENCKQGIRVENDGLSHQARITENVLMGFSEVGIAVVDANKAHHLSVSNNILYSLQDNVTGISVNSDPGPAIVIGNSIILPGQNAIGLRLNSYQKPVLTIANQIQAQTPIVYNAGAETLKYAVNMNYPYGNDGVTGIAWAGINPLLASRVYTRAELPSAPNGAMAVISNPESGKSHLVVRVGGTWRYMDGTAVSTT